MKAPISTRRARLWTIAETAEFLGVCEKTVRRRITAGDLRASKVGVQWRIRPEDIEAYLVSAGNLMSIRVH
ncbi:helix-turn-helix domain-containing protein [Ruegeria atlantica]|uniref:helix-turn-helix domain-containing protein n=1 Tax=Ruegeria atlantica TaxID=81569 RepID=UPI0024957A37|nr:helix-turn-helix domain-containing protein [Ruegeria atlantica]